MTQMELGYGPNQSVWKLATKIIPTQENYLRNMTPSFRWKSLSKNESYFFFSKGSIDDTNKCLSTHILNKGFECGSGKFLIYLDMKTFFVV